MLNSRHNTFYLSFHNCICLAVSKQLQGIKEARKKFKETKQSTETYLNMKVMLELLTENLK